ncbi:hypothetical protein CR513_53128, partial [Mucuna pruriens]
MGEKELMISTPLPVEYVEGDEEALETSFQALVIVGTTNVESEERDSKPSKAAIMAVKVLINNGFQPGRGLGKELEASDASRESREIWTRLQWDCKRGKTREKSLEQEVDTTRPLSLLHQWGHHIPRSNRNDRGLTPEASRMGLPHELGVVALVELERLLEQEGPKLQSGVEELEMVNLGGSEEVKEIWVGKQMAPDLRQKLVKLLEEYADVFAWSYRDMLGLDSTIVEHKLPLLPNTVPVW